MIIINTKHYASGKTLLKRLSAFAKKGIAVAVPAFELSTAAKINGIEAYAQHVDALSGTRSTGFLLPDAAKAAGATGTILNHSEHRITEKEIAQTIKQCKKVGLKICLCVESPLEAKKYKKYNPDMMAFEDKNLIASGKSVTDYNPLDILKFVKIIEKTKIVPLCGAGISTKEDVTAAKRLGCQGVLLASAAMKARQPKAFAEGLVKANNC